jgi:hypothetical protein
MSGSLGLSSDCVGGLRYRAVVVSVDTPAGAYSAASESPKQPGSGVTIGGRGMDKTKESGGLFHLMRNLS